ncbi:hypothetical protein C9374_009040 [Naegleria lovaniensis]|uniref:ADP-ribosylhydrolase ARH3 n=1 Tax=Naegleria lovaniensis TaxID=51637 RepID=A0AA88GHD4_NAELO|nr:uncharacterized protein C9374_009040 [Naegleria lovaniensis]KAG2377524.1 hypothetical protein C9374_009040 [Naegleria lovaniensis]
MISPSPTRNDDESSNNQTSGSSSSTVEPTNNKFLKHIGILYHSEKIKQIASQMFKRLRELDLSQVYASNIGNGSAVMEAQHEEELSRMLGALYGLSWGDVAGCPVEGWHSQQEIESLFGDDQVLNLFDFGKLVERDENGQYRLQNVFEEGCDSYKFPSDELIQIKSQELDHESNVKKYKRKKSPFEMFLGKCRFPGIHSDDTQQGMALINSMIQYTELNENGEKYFGDFWSEWLVKAFECTTCKYPITSKEEREIIGQGVQAFRDYGANSSRAFNNMKKKVPFNEAGSNSSGIGGIMRGGVATACFALFSHLNDDALVLKKLEKFACEQNFTTHATIEAAATCFATSLCAYKFMQLGPERAIEWLLQHLVEKVKQVEDTWWNERGEISYEKSEEEDENTDENASAVEGSSESTSSNTQSKKSKKDAASKKTKKSRPGTASRLPENQLKWKIYKSLPSHNAASECLEVLLCIIKSLRGTEKEASMLFELREKISELARKYKPEKKHMRAHVNQGFCLLAGMHAICCSLIPENPEIIYHCHKKNPQTDPSPQIDNSQNDVMKQFPNLVLRSIITLGYDTDTIGAIAGYLLGARFGMKWIPVQLLFDYERIRDEYASRLVKIYKMKRNLLLTENEDATRITVEPLEDYLAHEQFNTLIGEFYQHGIVDRSIPFVVTDQNKHIYGNSTSRVSLHSLENKK